MLQHASLAEVTLWPDPQNPGPQGLASLVQAQSMPKFGNRLVTWYDVKTDGVPRLYAGQNRYQRVPPFDSTAFGNFLGAAVSIMKPQRDFLVCLSGKNRSNEACWRNRLFFVGFVLLGEGFFLMSGAFWLPPGQSRWPLKRN